MASSMVLSGILFIFFSIFYYATGFILRQQKSQRNQFIVLFIVTGGYTFSLVAPAATVASGVLFCYYIANKLCQVKSTPNPGLMIAVEPLVASLLCSLIVFSILGFCIRKELIERKYIQSECWRGCDRVGKMCSTSASSTGSSSVSRWTRLTTSSSSSSSATNIKTRRILCCRLFLWSLIVAIFAWLIVNGWLGLLPGQWNCLALKPSGCKPYIPKQSLLSQQDAIPLTETATTPSYTLALWHEGYPIKTDGDNTDIFKQYIGSLVSFCINWKFSRCFLQIYNPTALNGNKAHTAFAPATVAKYFVQPLLDVNIEPGFVAYARPKDTGWDRAAPLTDIAKYVQSVEASLKKGTTGHVCCLAFDHEDLGTMAKDVSKIILSLKQSKLMWSNMQVGYAGGASLLSMPNDVEPGITDLYPELYWYGELAPGHESKGFFTCSTDCVTAMPCFSASCVTTPYRKYVNQASNLLQKVIVPHLIQQGLGGSKGMNADAASKQKGRQIWNMFSFEHLAGCCPERAFGPGNSCGTFDGLALWNKKDVLELFELYAQNAGYNSTFQMPIAVYEFQFIPPHLRDVSLSAAPVLVESASSAVPLLCDGT